MVRVTTAISIVVEPMRRFSILLTVILITACGGGGGSSGSNLIPGSNSSSSIIASSANANSLSSTGSSNGRSLASSNSSVSAVVNISGKITYDFVPHSTRGLDYSAVFARAGRGLLVELLDENNLILASTVSDSDGHYSLGAARNKLVKVRVKAQLLRTQSPGWNFKVTDNTNGNSLYSMIGSLVAATNANAVRNLHASSGWGGNGYTDARVAAPFAILDTLYEGVTRFQAAGNLEDFPPLELRWSVKNRAAEGDRSLGEIGTSYFGGDAIYILGDENNDTDEYDRHVLLHEWGHYIEASFARSDSIGGDHSHDDKLDLRVAMSEGFANAFSAMMLDDASYRDSSGQQQADGFFNDVSRKNSGTRGWYSEASVQSVIYNFYTSSSGKSARDFSDIFQVISAENYAGTSGLISIYTFADQLRKKLPAQATHFNSLLLEQNIEVTDEFGAGESNSGGYTENLPVYKTLPLNNNPVKVCSSNRFGSYNKLAVAQYFLLTVASAGTYQFSAVETADDSGTADPDFYLYRRGILIGFAEGPAADQESFSRFLSAGTYVLELVDARAKDGDDSVPMTACFDVRAQFLN
ncbi:hypothetical protein [Cellvibrio mixtus]|uniref:hypothetical protein n=1 Tax=Cellvibrio mixtus TaxID=39650 RepID=UPI0006942187|nr:hypothetical protein [Cellvibrio mixtus]